MQFATWLRPREVLRKGREADIFGKYRKHGITGVYVLAFSPFASMGFEPYHKKTSLGYDALNFCMKEIERNGMRGEIWVPIFANNLTKRQGALIENVEDKCWVCPTQFDSGEEVLSLIMGLMKKYPGYRGVNADYVRCHPRCPERNNGSKRFPECSSGAAYVTNFVERLGESLRCIKKELSVDVFVDRENDGTTSNEARRIHQDWGTWVGERLIHRATAMIYTNDNDELKKRIERAVKIAAYSPEVGLEIGIGVKSDTLSNLKPRHMERQIEIVQRYDVDRVALFPAHALTEEHLKILEYFV